MRYALQDTTRLRRAQVQPGTPPRSTRPGAATRGDPQRGTRLRLCHAFRELGYNGGGGQAECFPSG